MALSEPLLRSAALIANINPAVPVVASTLDEALDTAYAGGVATAPLPADPEVLPFPGYEDFTDAIKQALRQVITPMLAALVGDWVAPTLEGTWVNEGGAFQVCQYRREGVDIVRIRGVVQSGSAGSAIFTLPAGFRPPADIKFAFNGTTSAVIHAVTITSAGVVQHVSGSSTTQLGIDCSFSISA